MFVGPLVLLFVCVLPHCPANAGGVVYAICNKGALIYVYVVNYKEKPKAEAVGKTESILENNNNTAAHKSL